VIAGGERWCEAEFFRIRARLRQADGDDIAARSGLLKAVGSADHQGAALLKQRAQDDLQRMELAAQT
jgi:hypothetical protein